MPLKGKRWSAYLCPKGEGFAKECSSHCYLLSALVGPGTVTEARPSQVGENPSYNLKGIALLRYTLLGDRIQISQKILNNILILILYLIFYI